MSTPETRKYKVLGMNCGSCRSSVLEEVTAIAGVEKVDSDLTEGVLEIHGSGFDDKQVEAAVVAAGYELGQLN